MMPEQRKIAFSDSYEALLRRYRALLLAGVLTFANMPLWATPWIDPGDPGMRNDIQILADAGIIQAPATTWPMSWGDVLSSIDQATSGDLGPAERQAMVRLRRRGKSATRIGQFNLQTRLSAAAHPRTLRTFEDTPRESAEARAALDWTGLRLSYRLSVSTVAGPDDDRSTRLDGTYLGAVIGNYILSVGQMERWWGPGWDGSLILSTNARPVPAIALRRNFSDPFETRWLRWMGPWTMSLIWGQLEGNRVISDSRLFGLRVNFRPTPNLEISLSRTAQWCGQGRPCDAETFGDLLLGLDNSGENTTFATEPGNQLAGVDWRWRLPLRYPVAWYGQMIGEDEAGGLPSRLIGQFGLESWGYSPALAGTIRGHLEFSDTAAEFYSNQVRYDYAYEHNIYQSGYRYRGRSIGHAMDGDGRMISAGVSLDTDQGDQWRGLVRIVDLNRGGTVANSQARSSVDLINVELGYTTELTGGRLDVGMGVDRSENGLTAEDETEFRAHISWQSDL